MRRKVAAMVLFVLLAVHLTIAASFSFFSSPNTYNSGGHHPLSIAVADVNLDGKPDLVVANYCPDNGNSCGSGLGCPVQGIVGILFGKSDGTFQPVQTYATGNCRLLQVVVADVNGDGKPDLIVSAECVSTSNCTTNGISVMVGNGDGTFQPAKTQAVEGGSIRVAEVNGDGKPDLIVTGCADLGCIIGQVNVHLGNGDGTFQVGQAYASGGSDPARIQVADVDGDGNPDLLVANSCVVIDNSCHPGVVGVLLGNGDGTFQAAKPYASGGFTTSIAVADVNRDGKPDILVTNAFSGKGSDCANGCVGVLSGNGDGTFQAVQTLALPSADLITVADVNGDGRPDLLVTTVCITCSNTRVATLLGNGDGTFQTAQTYGTGGYAVSSFAVADVNGDGKPDVLLTNACNISGSNCATGNVGVLLGRKYPTATTVTASNNSSALNQTITFTATVGSAYASIPNGETVTFYTNGAVIGIGTTAGGVATFSTSKLSGGTHTIRAAYSGDANFKSSSGTVTQIVELSSSTTSLTCSPNPSTFGQTIQMTARVTSTAPGGATGVVTFWNGTAVLDSVSLNAGTAIFSTAKLRVGTNSLTATYHGNTETAKSASAPVSQVVH